MIPLGSVFCSQGSYARAMWLTVTRPTHMTQLIFNLWCRDDMSSSVDRTEGEVTPTAYDEKMAWGLALSLCVYLNIKYMHMHKC